jgi:hypothetical protein
MKLELAILTVLDASPRALPVPVIAGFIPPFTGHLPTHADLEAALRRLERAGDVLGTEHRDRGTVWKETAEGRLRLADL